jgi:hypothetical protein
MFIQADQGGEVYTLTVSERQLAVGHLEPRVEYGSHLWAPPQPPDSAVISPAL